MLRFLQNNTIIIVDRKNSLTRQKGEVKDMKKKKVDKILKGVVTAGVALGGASFMTEADMVYAAEVGEEEADQEFEKTGLEDSTDVEETVKGEALDTSSPEEDAPAEDAKDEGAPEEDVPAEDANDEGSPEEDVPEEDANDEGAPEEETPADETENASEENTDDDLPPVIPSGAKMMMMRGPLAKSGGPENNDGDDSGQDVEKSEEYIKAQDLLDQKNQAAAKVGPKDWTKPREFVDAYYRMELLSKGATNIQDGTYTKNDGNDYYKYSYLDADGVFRTDYVGYKTMDDAGNEVDYATNNIKILVREAGINEETGKFGVGYSNSVLTTVKAGTDNTDALKQSFDNKLQETKANATEKVEDEYTKAIDELNLKLLGASTAKSSNWEPWREVVIAYAKATIIAQGGSDISVGSWHGEGTSNRHYVQIDYTDSAQNKQSVFYDHVGMNDNDTWNKNAVTGRHVIIEKNPIVDENNNFVYDNDGYVKFKAFENATTEADGNTSKGREVARLSTKTNEFIQDVINKLNEIREETKNAPKTGGNEDGGQGGNENNDGQGGNENNDGQGGNENNDGQGGNENNDGQGGNENNDGQGGNENDGTTPGTGGNEDDGTTPGTGGNEDDGTTPGTGGNEDDGTTPGTGGNENGTTTPGTTDTPVTEDTTPGSGAPDAAEPQTPPPAASSADNAGTTPAQETPAEDSVTTQTVNEQTTAAASQTQTVNTVAGNAEQTTETQTTQTTQTSQSSVEIDNETVPLTVGASEDDTQDVVNIGETDVAKAAMIGIPEAPAAAGGLWSWILGVIAFISGKTAKDKKNEKGVFAEKDKDKK